MQKLETAYFFEVSFKIYQVWHGTRKGRLQICPEVPSVENHVRERVQRLLQSTEVYM